MEPTQCNSGRAGGVRKKYKKEVLLICTSYPRVDVEGIVYRIKNQDRDTQNFLVSIFSFEAKFFLGKSENYEYRVSLPSFLYQIAIIVSSIPQGL